MQNVSELLGRILLSIMFLVYGWEKVINFDVVRNYMELQGVPGVLLPAVIAFEVLASLAIIMGWNTKISALSLASFSIVTAFLFHFDFSNSTEKIMFMKNVTIAGGFLILTIHGAGEYSLDSHFRRNKMR